MSVKYYVNKLYVIKYDRQGNLFKISMELILILVDKKGVVYKTNRYFIIFYTA